MKAQEKEGAQSPGDVGGPGRSGAAHQKGAARAKMWLEEDTASLPRANFPGSGLVVLIGVVLLGMLPSTYYIWAKPNMERASLAQIESAPTTSRGRLELWFEFGAPMLHRRIAEIGRFSQEYPWLVTHAVRSGDELPRAFGIDASLLTPDFSHLDGLTVVVDLPAPKLLGPIVLRGEGARFVPVYTPEETAPDSSERLRELILYWLHNMPNALAGDIEGASLEVRIGGQVVIPRRLEGAPTEGGKPEAQSDSLDGR